MGKVCLADAMRENGIDRIDFLKIDAERHDYNVLLGLGDLLNPTTVPVLHVEESIPAMSKLLKSRGYVAYQAKRYYIDPLRKKLRKGNHHGYFSRSSGEGVNVLWLPSGGNFDRFLTQVCAYGESATVPLQNSA